MPVLQWDRQFCMAVQLSFDKHNGALLSASSACNISFCFISVIAALVALVDRYVLYLCPDHTKKLWKVKPHQIVVTIYLSLPTGQHRVGRCDLHELLAVV